MPKRYIKLCCNHKLCFISFIHLFSIILWLPTDIISYVTFPAVTSSIFCLERHSQNYVILISQCKISCSHNYYSLFENDYILVRVLVLPKWKTETSLILR